MASALAAAQQLATAYYGCSLIMVLPPFLLRSLTYAFTVSVEPLKVKRMRHVKPASLLDRQSRHPASESQSLWMTWAAPRTSRHWLRRAACNTECAYLRVCRNAFVISPWYSLGLDLPSPAAATP
eukprot:547212-Rhodomonas_salina.3